MDIILPSSLAALSRLAVPPVCKLMNYGKFRFEQSKKEKEARKDRNVVDHNGIRMLPGYEIGDLKTKIKNARKLNVGR